MSPLRRDSGTGTACPPTEIDMGAIFKIEVAIRRNHVEALK